MNHSAQKADQPQAMSVTQSKGNAAANETETLTQEFIRLLLQFEKSDCAVGDLAKIFGPNARLTRNGHLAPESGAAQFWQTYREQFEAIESTFTVVRTAGKIAVLEWSSQGARAGNPKSIHYRGVSILHFGDSCITDFATYYESSVFMESLH